MKQKLLAFFLASLPSLTQIAPALAQQQQQTAALSPDTPVNLPGLYYDPEPGPSPTFQQLTTAEQAGYVEIPPLPNGVQLPYQIDRAWPQGATPDQILKFGDLQQNPVTASFTKLTLRDISARQGTDIAGVPIGDVPLVYGLSVEEVDNLYTKLNNGEKITVDDAAPAIQAALGVLHDPSQAGKQLQQAALTTGEKVLITRLSKIPAFKGIPLQDLARGNWQGVISKAEQIQLAGIGKKIGPTLKKLPVSQIVPLVGDAINGNWQQVRKRAQAYILAKGTNVAVKEVIKAVPELKDLPLGAVPDLVNQPIEQTLPKIADLAIEEIPGAKDKTINSVPGLSEIPIDKLPFDLAFSFFAGDLFARFDIAYSGVEGPEEPSIQHALSGGSEDQKFRPIKCTLGQTKNQRADNCPHFEMRKFISSPVAQVTGDDDIEGKQWVQGDSGGKNGQGVKGGKGLLKWVNGGWEPAGIHPFGVNSHTKFVLKKITEYPDKKSTARLSLAFQFCVTIPLLGQQCTPHFLVIPTPFVLKEDGLFLVASRRNLPAEIARLRHQTLTAGVYCDPDQILATAGQSDASAANTKYGHHPFTETDEQLYKVTAVDGVTVGLTKDAASAFERMRADAAAQGLDIKAVSGFRSMADQRSIWDNKIASASPEVVARTSAPPGHSEHHTGLAVDVGNNQNAGLDKSWAQTPEYAWMVQNAGKYGFELSFPEGNSQGVSFEPWHWRFVGSDAAKSTFASANGHSTGTQGTKAQTIGQSAWGSETDVYNLILTSALESTGTQNQVDVAVAIMNRVVSPKHPNTITDVVFQPKQYEPNFGQAPVTSKEEAISRIARKTRSIQSAITEYETLEKALNDPNAIAASQAFLKGATDFRGQDWLHIRKSGDPYRGNAGANFYFQESQDPAVAAATLGVLGVESTAVDPSSVQSFGNSVVCNSNTGLSNISNGNFQQGSGVALGTLADPLGGQQYEVTSNFGWREDPVYGGTGFHSGIDLAWDTGTPIKASDGGEVVMSKWNGKYGNFILIDHKNGLATWYAHNSVNYVKVGDKVDPGQVIGEIGSTGKSTGPHLDFGVVENYVTGNTHSGQAVNPRKYINFPRLGSRSQPY